MATEVSPFLGRQGFRFRDKLVQRAIRTEIGEVGEVEVTSLYEHQRERTLGVECGEPAADRGSPREAKKGDSRHIQLVEDLGGQHRQGRRPEFLSRARGRLPARVLE